MEAEPVPDFMLRELLAPRCLDPELPPEPRAQRAPRTPGCLRPSGRSFWPAHQDSVTALRFLQETAEGLAQPPTWDTQALGPCWELKALGTLGPPPLARDAKNMLTPISQQCHSPGTPLASSAQPQRRPRKQLNPQRGSEKVDPQFEGVTLKFQIKPDASLQIIPSYSLACSSRSQGAPTGPAGGPEANLRGSEALGTRNTALGALAAGWCPGKVSSPRGYVADVECRWAPTQSQLRKETPVEDAGPRPFGSGGHWPPPWSLLQSGLAELPPPPRNAVNSDTHIVNSSNNKE
ncbi:hypothetical protein CB1_000418011 [Camelus ferus]|nr:hypothetical protein CB1_000418011 [Camelus ferus]